MTRILLVLICGTHVAAADPDPKSLAIPPTDSARASECVSLLGSRDFSERVDATLELRKLGRRALPSLREALASNSSPEVRFRIDALLPAAITADLDARLECLLADRENKFSHDIPGAKAFFAATSQTPEAKKLFAEMWRSRNRDMLLLVSAPEADLRRELELRREFLTASRLAPTPEVNKPLTVPDVASILFVESFLPDLGPTTGELGWPAIRFRIARGQPQIASTTFLSVLESALTGERQVEFAGLVRRWMATRDHAQTVYSAVLSMNRSGLPDALPAARNFVNGKVTGGPISYRIHAIAYLARYGNALDDLPILEKLFSDKSTVITAIPGGPASRRQTIQIRDVALAMALLLRGQEPSDYGLDFRSVYYGSSFDAQKYNPTAYYFDAETEEKGEELRATAFKKYTDWKDKPKAKK